MLFFEITPIGRIISRIAYDTDVVDGTLTSRVMGALTFTYWVIAATIVIGNVSVYMLAVIGPLLV
jgi:hypothetical protein